MSHSFFEPDNGTRSGIARGYLREDDGKVDTATAEREHLGRGYKVPNGAIYTTMEDMARFVAFEMGEEMPQVLKKESLEENFKRIVTANAGFKRGYGTGFQAVRLGDTVLYGHSGGVAGYQAEAWFDRGTRTGVIVLRNAVGGEFDAFSLPRAAGDLGSPGVAAVKLSTKTDDGGKYYFKDVPYGDYTFKASTPGLVPYQINLFVAADTLTALQVKLRKAK